MSRVLDVDSGHPDIEILCSEGKVSILVHADVVTFDAVSLAELIDGLILAEETLTDD